MIVHVFDTIIGMGAGGVLRPIGPSAVAPGPSGVATRTRLKGLTVEDETVLRLVGDHLGSLAASDLKARCAAGVGHDPTQWAARKRALTAQSSSRWAGSITKATHDQWALARRAQLAHIQSLEAGIAMITRRLSLPLGQNGTNNTPGGYRSRREWFAKTRRLGVLRARLDAVRAERDAGRVRIVRAGRRLLTTRHHLDAAQVTEVEWRRRWAAERRFLQADGESGKRWGNETIRIAPDGEVSLKLPAPLAGLANARHGRYVLAMRVTFPHRGPAWRDRIETDHAVAYRIHENVARGRWYITASWQHPPPPASVPLKAAVTGGVIGVDANDDHLAAWRLDRHGNPTGPPRRFGYDLTGTADHRDAQIRHALTRLLHWAISTGARAIAVEDLDFDREKTREKHGRRTRFRRLISRFPIRRLRVRLAGMAAGHGLTVIAVDPAYASQWGARHWRTPLCTPRRTTTRAMRLRPWLLADAPLGIRSGDGRHRPVTTRAIVAGIGPSRPDRMPGGVREPAPTGTDHGHDPCRPAVERTRATRTPSTVRGVRLSTSPGIRTHSRSVHRNGRELDRLRRRPPAVLCTNRTDVLRKSRLTCGNHGENCDPHRRHCAYDVRRCSNRSVRGCPVKPSGGCGRAVDAARTFGATAPESQRRFPTHARTFEDASCDCN